MNLDPNDIIDADDETLPNTEKDWDNPKKKEVVKNTEPNLSTDTCRYDRIIEKHPQKIQSL